MKLKRKALFVFSFVCGIAFSQEPPEKKAEPIRIVEKQDEIYNIIEELAEFPGEASALKTFIANNLKYPETAKKMGLQGKCYLQFIVSKTGELSNIKVKKGVADCPECDIEAIRLVKSMPKWKPGKVNGRAVSSLFSLPVLFKLS